jgi:hypothetical protein
MEIITTHSGTGLYYLGLAVIVRHARLSWKQTAAILIAGFIPQNILAWASRLGYVNVMAFLYFAVLARMYWLVGDRWRNTTVRNPSDKCSLGVFMGSGKLHIEVTKDETDDVGGHTAEMKFLVSSLDFERYTPRTYVYCHGDEMSLRTITELESTSNQSVRPVTSDHLTYLISGSDTQAIIITKST